MTDNSAQSVQSVQSAQSYKLLTEKIANKNKLIFFLLIKSHVYSIIGNKKDLSFLSEPSDINHSNVKLKTYLFNIFKPSTLLMQNSVSDDDSKQKLIRDNLIKETNQKVNKFINCLFIPTQEQTDTTQEQTDTTTCDEACCVEILRDFICDDCDFIHPFISFESVSKIISPNVKSIIIQQLLYRTQLLHDRSNKKCDDITFEKIRTLDELLEYAIFQAKYGQFSEIGYMMSMTYLDENPYEVFNKPTILDEILVKYNLV